MIVFLSVILASAEECLIIHTTDGNFSFDLVDIDSITFETEGEDNFAMSLNGDNGFGEVQHNDAYNFGTGDFTMEAWIMLHERGEHEPHVVAKGVLNGAQYLLKCFWPEGGGVKVYFGVTEGPGEQRVESGDTIRFNDWYHIAGVRSDNNLILYIDGEQEASEEIEEIDVDSDGSLLFGESYRFNDAFPGKLDEVRLWNDARTREEIANNWNRELRGDEEGLVGLWHFNEGEGDSFNDSSPTDNDGTLYGGYDWVEADW